MSAVRAFARGSRIELPQEGAQGGEGVNERIHGHDLSQTSERQQLNWKERHSCRRRVRKVKPRALLSQRPVGLWRNVDRPRIRFDESGWNYQRGDHPVPPFPHEPLPCCECAEPVS